MEQKVKPSPRIAPLPADHSPELKDAWQNYKKNLGFVPNSMLILQRKPKIVQAMGQLTAAVAPPVASTAWRTPRAGRCSSGSTRRRSRRCGTSA